MNKGLVKNGMPVNVRFSPVKGRILFIYRVAPGKAIRLFVSRHNLEHLQLACRILGVPFKLLRKKLFFIFGYGTILKYCNFMSRKFRRKPSLSIMYIYKRIVCERAKTEELKVC